MFEVLQLFKQYASKQQCLFLFLIFQLVILMDYENEARCNRSLNRNQICCGIFVCFKEMGILKIT